MIASPGVNAREEVGISIGSTILIGALLIGAVWDAFTKRIPNWLTFSMMVMGLVVSATGGIGLQAGAIGLAIAFALHFTLWQMGLEGAGDAKLMMAVGAFLGWEAVIEATLWRYVLLIPYAVITITVMRRWPHFTAALMWTAMKARGLETGERPEPTYMPFGPLIAVAVPLAMFTELLNFFAVAPS